MPKRDYTTKDGKRAKPVPKDATVTGMDLPDNVAPPVSDSTLKAVKSLIPRAAGKIPRKGWGGR